MRRPTQVHVAFKKRKTGLFLHAGNLLPPPTSQVTTMGGSGKGGGGGGGGKGGVTSDHSFLARDQVGKKSETKLLNVTHL